MYTSATTDSITADVLYVGGFRFPDGDAAGTRVWGWAVPCAAAAGLRVAFAGIERDGRPEDGHADGVWFFDEFPYVPTGEPYAGGVARLRQAWRSILAGNTTLQRLGCFDQAALRVIIAYNAPAPCCGGCGPTAAAGSRWSPTAPSGTTPATSSAAASESCGGIPSFGCGGSTRGSKA